METNICAVFNERDCLKIDSLNAISIISKIANTPLDSVMEIRKLRWVINKCSLELEKKIKSGNLKCTTTVQTGNGGMR